MYDDLVKSLRQCAEASCAGCKNDLVEIGCRGKLQREAADAIKELDMITDNLNYLYKEATTWIPVTERLPEDGETVWAVYKNSLFPNGKSWHKTLKYDNEMWTDENGYHYLTANITHWKYRDPLPEPPKEE